VLWEAVEGYLALLDATERPEDRPFTPGRWIFHLADIWYTIQLTDGPQSCVGRGR
jgi:hypothetical protein